MICKLMTKMQSKNIKFSLLWAHKLAKQIWGYDAVNKKKKKNQQQKQKKKIWYQNPPIDNKYLKCR